MLQLTPIKINKPVVNLYHKKLFVGTQDLQIIKEQFLSKYFVQYFFRPTYPTTNSHNTAHLPLYRFIYFLLKQPHERNCVVTRTNTQGGRLAVAWAKVGELAGEVDGDLECRRGILGGA
jgi:hypothetical protein